MSKLKDYNIDKVIIFNNLSTKTKNQLKEKVKLKRLQKKEILFYEKDNIVVEGGYKVSEHACRYCSYNKICCYQYRIKPIHLLHSKEDLID